ncbi:hypothetical protein H4R33_005352 [Dimargaris cristalligena]|nr:hypothetical protein H4R33_005352 [Dimargaris cristalligena]
MNDDSRAPQLSATKLKISLKLNNNPNPPTPTNDSYKGGRSRTRATASIREHDSDDSIEFSFSDIDEADDRGGSDSAALTPAPSASATTTPMPKIKLKLNSFASSTPTPPPARCTPTVIKLKPLVSPSPATPQPPGSPSPPPFHNKPPSFDGESRRESTHSSKPGKKKKKKRKREKEHRLAVAAAAAADNQASEVGSVGVTGSPVTANSSASPLIKLSLGRFPSANSDDSVASSFKRIRIIGKPPVATPIRNVWDSPAVSTPGFDGSYPPTSLPLLSATGFSYSSPSGHHHHDPHSPLSSSVPPSAPRIRQSSFLSLGASSSSPTSYSHPSSPGLMDDPPTSPISSHPEDTPTPTDPRHNRKTPGRKPGSGKPKLAKGYTPIGRNLKTALTKVLDKIVKRDAYAFFIKPVDTTAIPDYLTVIKRPMDFGTMRKKIDNRVYRNIGEFRADFELVIRNATTYNSPTTLYYRTARKLEEFGLLSIERMTRRINYAMANAPPEELEEVEIKDPDPELPTPGAMDPDIMVTDNAGPSALATPLPSSSTPVVEAMPSSSTPLDTMPTPTVTSEFQSPLPLLDGHYARKVKEVQAQLAQLLAQQVEDNQGGQIDPLAAMNSLYEQVTATPPLLSRRNSQSGSEIGTPVYSGGLDSPALGGMVSPLIMSRSNSSLPLTSPLLSVSHRLSIPTTPGPTGVTASATVVTTGGGAVAGTKRKYRDTLVKIPLADDGSRDTECAREVYNAAWDWEYDQDESTLFCAWTTSVTDVPSTTGAGTGAAKRSKPNVEYTYAPAGLLDFGPYPRTELPGKLGSQSLLPAEPAQRFLACTYGNDFGAAYSNSLLTFVGGCGAAVQDRVRQTVDELTQGAHSTVETVHQALYNALQTVDTPAAGPPALQLVESPSALPAAYKDSPWTSAATPASGIAKIQRSVPASLLPPGRFLSDGLPLTTLRWLESVAGPNHDSAESSSTARSTIQEVGRELQRQLLVPMRRTLLRVFQSAIGSPIDLRDLVTGDANQVGRIVSEALARRPTSTSKSNRLSTERANAMREKLGEFAQELHPGTLTDSLLTNFTIADDYCSQWDAITTSTSMAGDVTMPYKVDTMKTMTGTQRQQLRDGIMDLLLFAPSTAVTPATHATLRVLMNGHTPEPTSSKTNITPAATKKSEKKAKTAASNKSKAQPAHRSNGSSVNDCSATQSSSPLSMSAASTVVVTSTPIALPKSSLALPFLSSLSSSSPPPLQPQSSTAPVVSDGDSRGGCGEPTPSLPTPKSELTDQTDEPVPVSPVSQPVIKSEVTQVNDAVVDSSLPVPSFTKDIISSTDQEEVVNLIPPETPSVAPVSTTEGAPVAPPELTLTSAISATSPSPSSPPPPPTIDGLNIAQFSSVNPQTRHFLDSLTPTALQALTRSPDIRRKLQLLTSIQSRSPNHSNNTSECSSPSSVSLPPPNE